MALVRVAMVVLALPLDGLGVIAYLAAWALIPADETPTDVAPRRGAGVWIGAGLVGLGALMVLGGLWTTDGLDVTSLGATRIAAAGLLVLALGLLVGAVAGRARGLILPGAVLALVVLGMLGAERADGAALGTPAVPGVSTLERPATVADVPAGGYEWAAGDVVLDLRRLDAAALVAVGGPVPVRAELGVGTLEVVVPRGVGLDVAPSVGIGTLRVDPDADLEAEVGVGRLDVPGSDQRGLGLRRDGDTSAADGGATLLLRLEVGVGRIVVTEG